MPPTWPRKPDRRDPAYRRYGDRINFAFDVALFASITSGIWFVRLIRAETWTWPTWFTIAWAAVLVLHGLYVFGLADYTGADDPTASVSDGD